MTDVYADLRKEWTDTLLQLWHAYNKTPDQKQVKTYIAQLGHLQLGQLEAAVAHLLANHRYNSVPTIAEVMEAVQDTNRHDWQEFDGYTKVHNRPCRDGAKRITHTPAEYRESWGVK